MEFLNIGGGELLVIVLLAIILFGPEDILKIMRAIGEYTRKLQQMWTQMSAGLKGEFITNDIIPAEIQETIKETKASVADLQKTLAEVKFATEADLSETKTVIEDVKTTLEDMSTAVTAGVREVPKALETTLNEPAPGEVVPAATPQVAPPIDAVESESLEMAPASAVDNVVEEAAAPASTSVTAETHPNDEDL